ncbi:MAG: TIGR02147 family protein [Bdellovibrionales bacterium]|nr:TIGR02147 family protein [Bdellovibrionales bacterium]
MRSPTVLSKFYEIKKRDNPRFSLKSLSEKLSLSKSYTHQILKGDRTPPLSIVDEICKVLDVDDVSKDRLINQLFAKKGLLRNNAKSALEKEKIITEDKRNWRAISKSEINLIRNSHYMPILDCTLLSDYDGTVEYVADQLNLDFMTVETAFTELQVNGYLVKNEKGHWVKAYKFIEFNSKISRTEIRSFHKACLKKIEDNLTYRTDDLDVESRQITHSLLTCRKKDIPLIKQKIAAFNKELVEEFGAREKPDELYQLGLSFIPLSTGRQNE